MGFFDYASSVEATKRAREKTKAKSGYFSFDPDEVDTDANPNDVMRQAMFHQLMVDNSPVAASTVAGLAAGTLLQKGVKKLFGKKKEATPAESAPNLDAQIQDSLARRVEELTSTGKVGYPEALYQAATEISSKRGELPYAGAPYSPDAVDDATRLPRMQAASSLAKQAKELGYSPPTGAESVSGGNFLINGKEIKWMPFTAANDLRLKGVDIKAVPQEAAAPAFKPDEVYKTEEGLNIVNRLGGPFGRIISTAPRSVLQQVETGPFGASKGQTASVMASLKDISISSSEAIDTADELISLIEENKASIGNPGKIGSFINNMRATVDSIASVVAEDRDASIRDPSLYASSEEFKKFENSKFGQKLKEWGADHDMVLSLATDLGYAVALSREKSGKALNEGDIKRGMIGAGSNTDDPDSAIRILKHTKSKVLFRLEEEIMSAEGVLGSDNPEVKNAYRRFNKRRGEQTSTGKRKRTPETEAFLKGLD